MLQTDKELISALRTLAKAMDEMSSGCGHNTADLLRAAADRMAMLAQGIGPNDIVERLRAANGRIVQLERDWDTILHLWYKAMEMCDMCAHRCRNTEVESCEECDLERMCPTCDGENWEEARDDG